MIFAQVDPETATKLAAELTKVWSEIIQQTGVLGIVAILLVMLAGVLLGGGYLLWFSVTRNRRLQEQNERQDKTINNHIHDLAEQIATLTEAVAALPCRRGGDCPEKEN